MLEIVALSSLVSLITLAVLLLRRTRPETLRLWTHRYGAQKDSTLAKLHLSKPPWFLWLLVLLITASFAGAYFRDNSPAVTHRAESDLSVWVDRSLSAQLTLNDDPSLRARVAGELLARSSNLKFIDAKLIWDEQNSSWKSAVSFVELSSVEDIANYLESPPSPLGFNLTGESLRAAFESRQSNSEVRGQLLVVTDGQASTVQNLGRLSDLFQELIMVPTPPQVPFAKVQHEWVPQGLALSWGLASNMPVGSVQKQNDPWALISVDDLAARSSTSVGKNESSTGSQILPPEARPGLYSASIHSTGSSESKLIQIISARSDLIPEASSQERASIIFTHCSPYPSGPSELSPLADLQALAQFFSIKVRTLDCTEQTEAQSRESRSLAPNELDEWTFRRSSVWLVPLEESILNTFGFQKRLWVPNGYRNETDSLVYFTDPRSAQMGAGRIYREPALGAGPGSASLSVLQTPVQLEKDGAPLALLLAPPPPTDELELHVTPQGSSSEFAKFDIFASAFDSTPLIYRLGNERIYYLRTPLAMPNSELGRTGFWPTFWLETLRESPVGTTGLVLHHATVPEELKLPSPQSLSPINLAGTSHSGEFFNPLQPGLFLDASQRTLHLVEYPPSERDGQFLSAEELAEVLRRSGDGEASSATERQNQVSSKQTPLHAVLAAIAGLLSLGLFWLKLAQKKDSLHKEALMVLIGLLLLNTDRLAHAQGMVQTPQSLGFLQNQNQRLPDPLSVPFRIAWCSDRNRAEISEGYKKFRDLLERRGTIHLQPELLFGACVPGSAEIWWTDSAADLDPDFLKFHIQSGGVFVVESYRKAVASSALPSELARLEELSVGLRWEQPEKRGMLYRSFYLLQTFDGCAPDETLMLTLRKKQTAKSPVAILTNASFFGMDTDCFGSDDDYRGRSFINLMYTLLTMDYKEDQLQLPELLRRVRNLGLEP